MKELMENYKCNFSENEMRLQGRNLECQHHLSTMIIKKKGIIRVTMQYEKQDSFNASPTQDNRQGAKQDRP
jgi:hypothetical protein